MSITWLNPAGGEQKLEHWEDAGATTLGLRLSRDDLKSKDGVWPEVLILFNPHHDIVPFMLPERQSGRWAIELTTVADKGERTNCGAGKALDLAARSINLLV